MAPLISREHLETHDLGPDFKALIPAFLKVVEAIGFQSVPDHPLFQICRDERLFSPILPLLESLGCTKVTAIHSPTL
jgi:hypothetical protein